MVGAVVLIGQLLAAAGVQAGAPDRPSRVLIIVLDQARPDTIERYDMDNVKALMRRGANFQIINLAARIYVKANWLSANQRD